MSENMSIIVYRNPLEKAIWEGTYGAEMVPVCVGLAVGVIVIIILSHLVDNNRSLRNSRARNALQNLTLLAGAVAGFMTTYFLWI